MDHHRQIADRLRLLRERLGLNKSAMGRTVGVTPQAWYNYEIGRRMISVELALRVAEVHGVDCNWLYGGQVAGLPPRMRKLLATEE